MKRVELDIERLSKSGDGVALVEGRAVFVEGVLPGERVLADLHETGKVLRADVVEVLRASPGRRVAPCSLADRCGGCDWMHVAEATQVEQKQEIVLSALEHLGGVARDRYALLPCVTSPKALGYRRRAVLHPVKGTLGFFGRRSHSRVAVERCPALSEPLAGLPGRLGAALGPVLKDVDEVHLLECEGRVAISVHLHERTRPRHGELLSGLVRDAVIDGAVLLPGAGKGGVETFGAPVLEEDGVLHRPDGFAQANAEVNRRLVSQAVEWLDVTVDQTVLELYSGNGNFTFRLAGHAKSVLAIESSAVGVQLAQDSARRQGLQGVRLVQGDCEKAVDGLISEGQRFDRLLLDPPRTGASQVGRWASKLLVSRVVYVACDPASLARDAAELGRAGYAPVALQLFDLFPQTRHVEAMMAFSR